VVKLSRGRAEASDFTQSEDCFTQSGLE